MRHAQRLVGTRLLGRLQGSQLGGTPGRRPALGLRRQWQRLRPHAHHQDCGAPPHTSPPPLTATAPRHLLPFHLLPPLSPGARPATHHRAALRRQRSTLRRLPESRAAAGARSLALPLAGPERGSCVSFLRRLGARLAAPRRCGGRLIGCPATASAARASLPQSRRSHSFRPSRPRAPTGGLRRAARGPLRAVHGARAPPAMLAAGGARRAEPQRGSGRAGRTARGIRRSGLMFPPHPAVPLPHSYVRRGRRAFGRVNEQTGSPSPGLACASGLHPTAL